MSGFIAGELFSLAVLPDGEPVPAINTEDEAVTFRITMAAIDPTAVPKNHGQANGPSEFVGSVLKILRVDEDEYDSDEDEESMDMAKILEEASDESSDDEEINGGPSDASKSSKAKRKAALKEAIASAEEEDEEMDVDGMSPARKGKAKVTDDESLDSETEGTEIEGAEEFVICTLDPTKSYQQTLDLTVGEHETVFFRATGTHKVYLTGNVLYPTGPAFGRDDYDSDDEEGFGMPQGDEDEEDYDVEDESDELDDVEDPRITEVASDEEEDVAPKLIKAEVGSKKGKNKRPLEDSSEIEPPTPAKATADSTLEKALKPAEAGAQNDGDQKLSKNQLKKMRKKMKNNDGTAVETTMKTEAEDKGEKATVTKTVKETSPADSKSDKKVQFAKTLVQGPSGSSQPDGNVAKTKTETKTVEAPKVNGETTKEAKTKGTQGPRNVQGVTIEDKSMGSGQGAKNGHQVSMRYIGKLQKDKKVFDSNKKGAPFKFTLGKGQVIKGWEIGMQGIAVGGERRITIPPHLAYGSKANGEIPANSHLVFDVKCLSLS